MILLRFKLIVLLSTIIITTFGYAQKSIVVEVTGNKIFSNEFFEDCIIENSSKSISVISEKIKKKFNSNGFYNSKIINFILDSTSSKKNNIYLIEVNEDTPTFIRNVKIDSLEKNDSSILMGFFSYLEGQVFVEEVIEESIEKSLVELENIGYPFASIHIKSVVFENDQTNNHVADLYLSVRKEFLRKIDKVEISGNSKTKDGVIINAARLTKGEIYSQKRIDEIPILLNKLRFFENVSAPTYLVDTEGEGFLKIEVKETNTNSFDGILGYVPSNKNGENGYLTGFVNIGLRNLFGTGRGLWFKWQQENSLTQELEMKYLEPWILNQPFNLNFQFFQRKQDSSYVKRILGGSIEYLANENISASILLESESIIPSLNSNQIVLNSSSLNSGIKLELDYRDDIYSPQKGVYFSSIYKYRSKRIEGSSTQLSPIEDGNLEYHNYELNFEIFYSPFINQVIALGVHAKEIIGDYFDISDYFRLGGTNSLRGYRENQFVGNRIIWSNFEYRFLLSKSSYVFAFYDAGYYLVNEDINNNISRLSDLKNGYGFGISLATSLGIMKVSYAFAEGNSLTNGLIHFGLLNDF